jgi:hypothetical protein
MADSEQALSPKDFGQAFKSFLEQMSSQAGTKDPVFRRQLQEHFGTETAGRPAPAPIMRNAPDKGDG